MSSVNFNTNYYYQVRFRYNLGTISPKVLAKLDRLSRICHKTLVEATYQIRLIQFSSTVQPSHAARYAKVEQPDTKESLLVKWTPFRNTRWCVTAN